MGSARTIPLKDFAFSERILTGGRPISSARVGQVMKPQIQSHAYSQVDRSRLSAEALSPGRVQNLVEHRAKLPDPWAAQKRQFGLGVKARRKSQGLSQYQLAERASLRRSYVADIERGSRNVSIESISKLAEALKVPASGLFASLESSEHPNQSEIAIVKRPPVPSRTQHRAALACTARTV
jgi:transcriptional regulator with XRE-family HTH domain